MIRAAAMMTSGRLLVLVLGLHSLAADTVPVKKTIGWFAGHINDRGQFLRSEQQALDNTSVRIADRVLRCCNGLSVTTNGTLPMTSVAPYLTDNESYAEYTDAGIEVLVDMGGEAKYVPAMFARKEAFAQEMLDLTLRWNFTGYTMDWEFGDVMNWTEFNETMTIAGDLLHRHGKKLGVCIQSGCGDDKPGWAGATNPPCATLFRDMPWADTLSDMGTYPLGGPHPLPPGDIMLQECSPKNEYTRWCGLEGQVLNHLQPLSGKGEYAMGAANGQYSAALWPQTCEQNGTVAGAWTQPTLHGFLSFLDRVGVRSVDVWCSNAEMPCSTLVGDAKGQACGWFVEELAWWKSNGM